MTDKQKLNVRDFMDRLMYLASQIVACRSFSPVDLCGNGIVNVNVYNHEDYKEILDLYKIPDSAVEIRRSEDATVYNTTFRNLEISNVALRDNEGYLGVDK